MLKSGQQAKRHTTEETEDRLARQLFESAKRVGNLEQEYERARRRGLKGPIMAMWRTAIERCRK